MEKRKRKSNILTSKLESEIELLQRHVDMLESITDNEPIGIIRLAELLKCPQHKVRYSMRMLEQEGLIEPSLGGAVTTKKVGSFLVELKKKINNMTLNMKKIYDSI